jgi:hypothetical protein
LHPIEALDRFVWSRLYEKVLLGVSDAVKIPALPADVFIFLAKSDGERRIRLGSKRLTLNLAFQRLRTAIRSGLRGRNSEDQHNG